jgi:uncharacterized protein (DUF2336 family)
MSELALSVDSASDQAKPEAPESRSRTALLKRLTDVACLPASRINSFERAMTADLLVEMLPEAGVEARMRIARRLATLNEMPSTLTRLLLRDDIEVARPLLVEGQHLSDADLVDCVMQATPEHRRLAAGRRGLSELVSEAIVATGDLAAIETLLLNSQAKISAPAVEVIVAYTQETPRLAPLLLRRPEVRPSHAYVMFWWTGPEERKLILQRFAVTREVLQEAVTDVFPLAAAEGWQDPLSRKGLQFIERRQRNRAALERSPYNSLDEAVAAAAGGLTRELAEEISYLSGVKPTTGAKIFTDKGGEAIAVLCKATGLPKAAIRALWRGMRRAETDESGFMTAALERVVITYDMMAVDRAQTVLRYWNWSLTSALTPALLRAIREGDDHGIDAYSAPQRTAMLALSGDFGR